MRFPNADRTKKKMKIEVLLSLQEEDDDRTNNTEQKLREGD